MWAMSVTPWRAAARGTAVTELPRTATTEIGKVELRVALDRNVRFELVSVAKGQRRLEGLPTRSDISLRQGHVGPGTYRHRWDRHVPGHHQPDHQGRAEGPEPAETYRLAGSPRMRRERSPNIAGSR
jgi:hypothetical protein